MKKTIDARWYDYPQYYDLALRAETKREADFIEAACRKYVPFRVRRMLEPACGTGRLLAELAARGYRMTGLDLSRPSLAYLRRRLQRRGLRAELFEQDMSQFRLKYPVGAAFCTFNSFRHLTSEDQARAHLHSVAQSLRPGGIYILGLHLLPERGSGECLERWTAKRGQTRVTVTLRVLSTDRRRRLENLRVSMLVRTPRRQFRLRDEFAFRIYTPAQFHELLAWVPQLEICGLHDFWYEIDRQIEPDDLVGDVVFILRRRNER